jgi:Flp pilus assembly protein TadG
MPAIRSKEERRRRGGRDIVAILRRLATDQGGVTAPIVGISMALLLGVAGLGTEAGTWYVTKRAMQGAADAAAFSAAVAGGQSESYSADGAAVAARFGYVNGANNVTLQINNPPTAGAYAGSASAYEVIISQPQPQLFSKLFMAAPTNVRARAVAITTPGANPCITTLGNQNDTPGVTVNGHDTITLTHCNLIDNATGSDSLLMNGNAHLSADVIKLGGGDRLNGGATVTDTGGLFTNQTAQTDPYKDLNPSVPGSCNYTNMTVFSRTTINPGKYCGGLVISSANVTLNSGIYYMNDGSLIISGNSTVKGDSVTIVFSSDNGTYGTFTVNGNSKVTLTAPTSVGWNQGFLFFESSSAPTSSVNFNGGNNLNLTGILYFPNQNITYNGSGTSACSRIYAHTITFNGDANFGGDCSGIPGLNNNSGSPTTQLVE